MPASPLGSTGDAALVALVAEGSNAALAEIYRRHGGPVFRRARQVCGDDLADDVVQDVFLRLWERPEAFEPDRGSLIAYLLMRTKSRAVDVLRSGSARRNREREGRTRDAGALDRSPVPECEMVDMWDLLGSLPATHRRAIALAYYGGYSYREVAALLQEPVGTIKSRIRNGLAQLRPRLLDAVGP